MLTLGATIARKDYNTLATTEDSLSLAATQKEEDKRLPPGSTRFDWIVTILCTLLIGGVFLDGWATPLLTPLSVKVSASPRSCSRMHC
jgi:hypothetical protein